MKSLIVKALDFSYRYEKYNSVLNALQCGPGTVELWGVVARRTIVEVDERSSAPYSEKQFLSPRRGSNPQPSDDR